VKHITAFLDAVSIDGVKTAHTVVGAYDRVNFEFAIEQFVVPIVGSFANGKKIVQLWYCPIHYSPAVLRMVRSKGGIVLFLP